MAPLPTAKFAHMPLLRSLAGYWDARGYKHGAPPELGGVVQFVTDSFNHTRHDPAACRDGRAALPLPGGCVEMRPVSPPQISKCRNVLGGGNSQELLCAGSH